MKIKVFLIITVLIFVSVVTALFLTYHHWWRELGSAQIVYNGDILRDSKIYQSTNNDILIRLKGVPNESSPYIFYPDKKLIGVPNANQFIYVPKYAFSKETPPPAVMGDDRIKIENDMNLLIIDNTVEFTTLNGGRVKIILQGL